MYVCSFRDEGFGEVRNTPSRLATWGDDWGLCPGKGRIFASLTFQVSY